jgi:lipid-A-disaccharide synthase
MQQQKKIFIIAGEESGDNLGYKLIKNLKAINADINFIGIGGNKMAYEGLHIIFPMQEINLMGFSEILPHIPRLLKRINQTVDLIIAEKPDILITIDSPGFNYRVAKKLKERNFQKPMLHYVAPSVWAYKPERAKKTAQLFDHLISIIPWENKYFESENLPTTFIGHPVFEDLNFLDEQQKNELKNKYSFFAQDKIIAILPGSRKGEVDRLLPIFIDAALEIYKAEPNAKFILMPTENLRNYVSEKAKKLPNCLIICDTENKRNLLQICSAAIVKSGTVALEVAALKCPHIICYKVSDISHWLIRRMLNISFANLINISANKEIIHELIQEDCNSNNISKEILKLIGSGNLGAGQIADAAYELAEMGLGEEMAPSKKAAELVYSLIK